MSLKTTQNSSPIYVFLFAFVMSIFSFGFTQAQDCEEGTSATGFAMTSDPMYNDGFYGATYSISLDGAVVASGPSDEGDWASLTDTFCLADGCYEVYVSNNFYTTYGWAFGDASGVTDGSTTLASIGSGCVTGCTDEAADNYNADSDISDNTLCEYSLVQGCMDETACNYDASAEQDNGSCTYADPGFNCDGSCASGDLIVLTLSDQYDDGWDYFDGSVSTLTIDGTDYGSDYLSGPPIDISICLDLSGCYDAVFTPANGWATENSYTITDADGNELAAANAASSIFGSGCVTGCTDETAENYNADSDISDNTLCEYALVQGCTDATACNYDELAEQDNGSCTYADPGFNCDGTCASGELVVYSSGSYAGENQFLISDCDGNELASMSSGYIGFNGCVDLTDDYQVTLTDTYGDTWNGGSLTIGDVTYDGSGLWIGAGGNVSESVNYIVGSCGIPGCNDVAACNYDSTATFDDGSCEFALDGQDCDGNCLNGGTATDISVMETSSWGSTYSLLQYGGSWSLVDISTGESLAAATSDDETLCLVDGCYEITGLSGSGASYPFGYSVNGGDVTVPGAAGEAGGTGYISVGETGCPTGCTDVLANNYDADAIVNDGCVYCVDGVEVSELADGTLPDDLVVVTINTGSSWSAEIHWEIRDDSSDDILLSGGNSLPAGGTSGDYDNNETYVTTSGCLPDGCYKLITYDTYGDGWNGNGSFAVSNQFGTELIPSTVMGPNAGNNTEAENNDGYSAPYQELATYFVLGDGTCDTYGCTDPAASNYDATVTVDDETCIYCEDGDVDVSFSFNQENITSDEVYVYNETDTVFSVEPFELGAWDGKSAFICVPVGCYTISMGSSSNGGWTDGSQLQILDDLTDDYFFLDVEDATLDMTVVSIGGAVCEDNLFGGCTDPIYDNYNPDATFDNGSCAFLCENATAGNTSTATAGEDDTFGPWYFVSADADGNGAEVTFEELAEGVSFSYISYNLDSCNGTSFTYNINNLTIDLAAGQSLYFQAQNPYNYVDSVTTIFADVMEIPDSSFFGCMDEVACNYDSAATYQPDFACEYASAGFDCDGVELPSYMDVELDFSGSYDLCSYTNSYDATNLPYPGSSFYTNGPDYAYAFESNGSMVMSTVQANGGYDYVTIHVYEGHPDSLESAVSVDYDQLGYGLDQESIMMFDTDSGSTYFVVVDTYSSSYCYPFDISITNLVGEGGCTDSTALNYNADASYDDLSCEYPGGDCANALEAFIGANSSTIQASAADGDDNQWFYLVMPGSGELTVSTCDETSLDTRGAMYDECSDWTGSYSSNALAFNDDACGLQTEYSAVVEADTVFLVWTDQYMNAGGTFTFNISFVEYTEGCMDTIATNYNPDALIEDGSCEYLLVQGCIDSTACNFDPLAEQDNGTCEYVVEGFDCDGNCLEGTHVFFDTEGGYSYDGYSNFEISTCDGEVIAEMTNGLNGFDQCVVLPENYVVTLTTDFTSDFTNYWAGSVNVGDDVYTLNDLSGSQMTIVGDCGVAGCTDVTALNYDSTATFEDGTCTYPLYTDITLPFVENDLTSCGFNEDYGSDNTSYSGYYLNGDDVAYAFAGTGNGVIINMTTSDTYTAVIVFDGNPLEGANVVASAESGFSSGTQTVQFDTDTANTYFVVMDSWPSPQCFDFDLSIEEQIGVGGCTDEMALNYNADATYDDGSCTYPTWVDVTIPYVADGLTTCGLNEDFDASNTSYTGYYLNGDDAGFGFIGTGSQIQVDVATDDTYTGVVVFDGDPLAGANVVAQSTIGFSGGNHSFTFETTADSMYVVVVDSWPSPQCIDFDISLLELSGGCTDTLALNYDEFAAYDDGSCEYDFVWGCIDSTACNFDALADVDNGSCTYADAGYDCNGDCLADTDEDGICDDNEIAGCTDAMALNYDETATDDDGTCEYCTDDNILLVMEDDYFYGGWDGASFSMTDGTNSFTASLNDGGSGTYDEEYLCVPAGCYEVTVGGGFYDYEITFSLGDILVNQPTGTYSDISIGGAICNPMMVDFSVDMSLTGQPNMIDYDNVVINGSWNGWGGWGVTLSDEDGDNVWTGSGEFDPSIGQFEYVVAVTGPTDGYSGWGMQWGNGCEGNNFLVIFEEGVDTYSEAPTVGCDVEPAVAYVDFTVDMNAVGSYPNADYDNVVINGSWNGWGGWGVTLSDEDGDNVWTGSGEFDPSIGQFEYVVAVTGAADGYSGWGMQWGNGCEGGNFLVIFEEGVDTYSETPTVGCVSDCDDVTVNFSVDASDWIGTVIGYTNVVINGSFANWNGWGVELTDADGDGIYTGSTTVLADVTHQYVHALTGPADGYSGWGIIGYAPESCALGIDPVSGDSAPNYFFSGECGEVIDLPTVCFSECTECIEAVPGCTDASADNFDPNATEDDGSCTFCNSFEAVLLGTSDVTTAGGSDGSVQATGDGGSNNYSISVEDANGVEQNPFALSAGDYFVVVTDETSGCFDMEAFTISEPTVADDPCDIIPSGLSVDNIIHNRVTFNWSAPSAAPSHYMIRYRALGTSSWTVMTAGPINSNEFTGTSRTRYFMEPGTTYEWGIRARVLNEDGSTNCQSSWSASSEYTTLDACANLENLSVDNVEANWVTFYADAPAAEWGVWQSKGKMRAVGTNAYRYVNGDSDGTISGVLKGNFTASTDYEWHTKSWCTGNVDANGDSDPQYHSGWGDFSAFSTEAACDKMPTNLTTSSNGANTAVIMSWDTPATGAPDHYFLEMTNLTTGAVYEWNNIPGTDNSKTKFNQNPGDEISWRIRGACGTNGTSWATIFSQPATYTLGGARLANNSVANLDVYPNPSRDIFNVTFTSEEAQTMTVKVVNMIGEEVFTEELTEFVGQYTQVIDMNTQPKGVYFLEITTSTGGINKKIVLQ
jgi:hypothetical protein